MDFPKSSFDVDINSTIDHLISYLTLKFNTIDATTICVYHKGKLVPYENTIIGTGIAEDDELEIGVKSGRCCVVI